jgi:hypothetical protein
MRKHLKHLLLVAALLFLCLSGYLFAKDLAVDNRDQHHTQWFWYSVFTAWFFVLGGGAVIWWGFLMFRKPASKK